MIVVVELDVHPWKDGISIGFIGLDPSPWSQMVALGIQKFAATQLSLFASSGKLVS